MNNPVDDFISLIEGQKRFLEFCEELDQYYLNVSQSNWKRRFDGRRGWTQQDVNRLEFFLRMAELNPPSDAPAAVPKFAKRTSTRAKATLNSN